MHNSTAPMNIPVHFQTFFSVDTVCARRSHQEAWAPPAAPLELAPAFQAGPCVPERPTPAAEQGCATTAWLFLWQFPLRVLFAFYLAL